MDIAIILGLILLNGVFAMSEIAIVSAKRLRLQQAADNGNPGARKALHLAEEPTRFLSTIQIGITLIGIMAGALGEASLLRKMETGLLELGLAAGYAQPVAWVLMIAAITYLSLIFGELVPKRLALMNPERISSVVARPMDMLAQVARPLVWLLSRSTEGVLRLLRARRHEEASLIEEEIHSLVAQGAESGVLERSEKDMVKNVLRLDEKRAGNIMTLREDAFYIDLADSDAVNLDKINRSHYFWIPACRGSFSQVEGILSVKDVLAGCCGATPVPLASLVQPPLYVAVDITLLQLLEAFKQSHHPIALVQDHNGQAAGLVTIADVMMAIVGEFPHARAHYDPDFVQRQDGSWLIDGQIDIASLKEKFSLRNLPEEDRNSYHTLGGLLLTVFDRIPKEGESIVIQDLRMEIVDMDGARVDKVLVTPVIPIPLTKNEAQPTQME